MVLAQLKETATDTRSESGFILPNPHPSTTLRPGPRGTAPTIPPATTASADVLNVTRLLLDHWHRWCDRRLEAGVPPGLSAHACETVQRLLPCAIPMAATLATSALAVGPIAVSAFPARPASAPPVTPSAWTIESTTSPASSWKFPISTSPSPPTTYRGPSIRPIARL